MWCAAVTPVAIPKSFHSDPSPGAHLLESERARHHPSCCCPHSIHHAAPYRSFGWWCWSGCVRVSIAFRAWSRLSSCPAS
eukprot:8565160-Prorocentrum_lima.AAC.1